jgi:hypothetical protein
MNSSEISSVATRCDRRKSSIPELHGTFFWAYELKVISNNMMKKYRFILAII